MALSLDREIDSFEQVKREVSRQVYYKQTVDVSAEMLNKWA